MIEKTTDLSHQRTPLVLIILDGWGYCENTDHNAIASAHIPFWQYLWTNYPHTLVEASGIAVGLPEGQMGNSEVGHLHMAAGRLVPQDLTRINNDIASGAFHQNPVLTTAIDELIKTGHALHILGLLSPGGVHSQENHIYELIKVAAERGLNAIYLHAFLDGRDTPPQSAENAVIDVEALFRSVGCGKIASLIGRYYAMDRDKRWDRTERAYNLLTQGIADFTVDNAIDGLKQAYSRGETDEFVQPTAINAQGQDPIILEDGDAVIFMNFRADRARQLTHVLTDKIFTEFPRQRFPALSNFITLTQYAENILATPAYPPISLSNFFGAYISTLGYKQLRIAETEKYAHVTFFFNGGEESCCPGEDRILIPSPKVATYDLQPEMSAPQLTDQLIEAIKRQQYDVIICNFANPDMVGHSGDFNATITAIEVISASLEKIVTAFKEVGGEALITADHGNAECMFDPNTGQPHTAHTTNLVPVIYVGRHAAPTTSKGVLYDIAPTLLYLMNVDKPKEMTGQTLFKIP